MIFVAFFGNELYNVLPAFFYFFREGFIFFFIFLVYIKYMMYICIKKFNYN